MRDSAFRLVPLRRPTVSDDRRPARRRRASVAGLVLPLVLLLGAAGCAGSAPSVSPRSDGAATASGGAPDAESAVVPGDTAAAPGAGVPAPGAGGVTPSQADESRKIIRTGSLTVRNKDVDSATRRARDIVREQGATVHSARESGEGTDRRTRLVIKVAPEKFDDTMTRLREVGQVVNAETGQQDVTEQVVDLEARLKAAIASRDRVQELTNRAGTISELVALERELNTRNQEVDSLTARLKAINGQVAESTITLNIGATAAAAKPAGTFGAGFENGWAAFQWVLSAFAVLLGFLIPFLPLVALVALAVWAWRRYRAKHPKPTKQTWAQPAPAGAPWGGWSPPTGPGGGPGNAGQPRTGPAAGAASAPGVHAEDRSSGAAAATVSEAVSPDGRAGVGGPDAAAPRVHAEDRSSGSVAATPTDATLRTDAAPSTPAERQASSPDVEGTDGQRDRPATPQE